MTLVPMRYQINHLNTMNHIEEKIVRAVDHMVFREIKVVNISHDYRYISISMEKDHH